MKRIIYHGEKGIFMSFDEYEDFKYLLRKQEQLISELQEDLKKFF